MATGDAACAAHRLCGLARAHHSVKLLIHIVHLLDAALVVSCVVHVGTHMPGTCLVGAGWGAASGCAAMAVSGGRKRATHSSVGGHLVQAGGCRRLAAAAPARPHERALSSCRTS